VDASRHSHVQRRQRERSRGRNSVRPVARHIFQDARFCAAPADGLSRADGGRDLVRTRERILEFPAENFVAFFSNHRLLQYDRPKWRSIKGGSRVYVDRLTAAFRDRLRLGRAVTSIRRTAHGVVVEDSLGHSDTYDHIVIATHSDQALDMLTDADANERSVLGDIRYAPNIVYLHRDPG
jgi:predicted NAD/FAD-binding protein